MEPEEKKTYNNPFRIREINYAVNDSFKQPRIETKQDTKKLEEDAEQLKNDVDAIEELTQNFKDLQIQNNMRDLALLNSKRFATDANFLLNNTDKVIFRSDDGHTVFVPEYKAKMYSAQNPTATQIPDTKKYVNDALETLYKQYTQEQYLYNKPEYAKQLDDLYKTFTPQTKGKARAEAVNNLFEDIYGEEVGQGIENQITLIDESIAKYREKLEDDYVDDIKTGKTTALSRFLGSYKSSELRNLNLAEDLIGRIKDELRARKNQSGFWRGIIDTDWSNVLTFEIESIVNAATKRNLFERIDKYGIDNLRDDEKLLLDALVAGEAIKNYPKELTTLYNVGASIVPSISFMASYGASKALLKGVKTGVKKVAEKALKKYIKDRAKELGVKTATETAGKAAAETAKKTLTQKAKDLAVRTGKELATSAGQVPLMPTYWANRIERNNGDIQIETNGFGENTTYNYKGRKISDTPEYDAYMSTLIDIASEKAGALIPFGRFNFGKYFGKAIPGDSKFWQNTRKFISGVGGDRLKRAVDFNGFIGEYSEELIAGTLNSMLVGDQKIEDVFAKQNMIETALSVGVISLGMGLVSGGLSIPASKKVKKEFLAAEEELKKVIPSPREREKFIREVATAGYEQQAAVMNKFVQAAENARKSGDMESSATYIEAANIIGRYMNAYNRYQTYNSYLDEQIKEKLETEKSAIQEATNPDMDNNIVVADYYGKNVKVVAGKVEFNEDGTVNTENSSESVVILNEDGSKQQVSPQGLTLKDMYESSELEAEAEARIRNEVQMQSDAATAEGKREYLTDEQATYIRELGIHGIEVDDELDAYYTEDPQLSLVVAEARQRYPGTPNIGQQAQSASEQEQMQAQYPRDAKGNPDFTQITPEQATQILTSEYPEDYAEFVQNKVAAAEKRIEKASKAKPQSTDLSDIKTEREAIRAEQTAAQQEYDYWNNVKTLLNRQDVNTTEQIAEEQPADANLSVAENEILQPGQTVEETTAAKQEEQQQYPTDEAGEPLWYEMTEKQFDVAMTELGDDADAFIADNIKEAQESIKKAEKAKPKSSEFAKRKAEQQSISAEKATAQRAYDYWTAQQARRIGASQRKAPQVTQQVGENITGKYQTSNRTYGNADIYILPNGEKINGRYVIVEADAITPSHDVNNGYQKSEGFPTDENGNTINDRDYQADKSAQSIVEQNAANYDARAIQTPVIVTNQGIVLSGNGRTMSGQIAAGQGTDTEYLSYLKGQAGKYGFTPEQVASYKHPRLVLEIDGNMPLTAATFSKFNAEEKKTVSPTEKAVKAGKTVTDITLEKIAALLDDKETLSDVYADETATAQIIKILQSDGVININEVAELMDGKKLSAQGKDFLETLLVGKILNEQSVRLVAQMRNIRATVIKSIMPLLNNSRLRKGQNGENFSLSDELNKAIEFIYAADRANMPITDYISQTNLFDANPADIYDTATQIIAVALTKGQNNFKQFVNKYNTAAEHAASGQIDIFAGRIKTKKEILKEITGTYGNTGQAAADTQSRLGNSKVKSGIQSVRGDDAGNRGADTGGRGTEQGTERVTTTADTAQPAAAEQITETPGKRIEDYGAQIAGARKDILRDIARNLENTTLQSLISLPFSKAFSRPNLKKAIESGALREKDVYFAEAVMAATLSRKKPKAGTKKDRIRKYNTGKTEVESWAEKAFEGIQILEELFNAEETERDALIKRTLSERTYGEDQVKAHQQKMEQWNPGKTFNGTAYPINQIALFYEVLRQINLRDRYDISFPVVGAIPNTANDYYYLITPNGERLYYLQKANTFDNVVSQITYLTKLYNDIEVSEHPRETFSYIGKEPIYITNGWIVFEYANPRSLTPKRLTFDTKEQAEAYREKINKENNKKYVSEPFEAKTTNGYKKYEAVFTNPITGERLELGIEYDNIESAKTSFEDDYQKLNEAANKAIAQKNAETKDNKKELLEIIKYYDSENKKFKYGIIISNSAPKNNPFNTMPLYLAEGIETKEEALSLLEKNKDDWEKKAKEFKEREQKFVYFDGEGNTRIGEDYRQGKNVSTEEFATTFGFRGVQFGNWTNQEDRQAALNNAYDSFMDLSRILNVSPRALSLNGELGIAFGSRGSGGANAHYEAKEVVINLTKTRGAGSLAHEWWHALDNYFARQSDIPAGFTTADKNIKLRSEMRDAFDRIIDNITKSDYHYRSRNKGTYWGAIEEETARLFGEWIVKQLSQHNAYNHFLSRGIGDAQERYARMQYEIYQALNSEFDSHKGKEKKKLMTYEEFKKTPQALKGFVYPTKKELETLGKDLDNLFDVIQERVDKETGNIALYRTKDTEERYRESEEPVSSETLAKDRAELEEIFGKSFFPNVFETVKKRTAERMAEVSKAAKEFKAELKNAPEIILISDISDIPKYDAGVNTMSDIYRRMTVKGWYSPGNGKIYVNLASHLTPEDVKATILHEAVGHSGLRRLLGKDAFDRLCNTVYQSLPEDKQKKMLEATRKIHPNATDEQLHLIVGDEYMATLAEGGAEQSIPQRIISAVREFLRSVGIDLEINEADLRYLLHASYKNIKDADAVTVVNNSALLARLRKAAEETHIKSEAESLFRLGKKSRDAYERLLAEKRPDMPENMRKEALDYLDTPEERQVSIAAEASDRTYTETDKAPEIDYDMPATEVIEQISAKSSVEPLFRQGAFDKDFAAIVALQDAIKQTSLYQQNASSKELANRLNVGLYDAMAPLKDFISQIEESRGQKIDDDHNPYYLENASASKAQERIESLKRDNIKPLAETTNDAAQLLQGREMLKLYLTGKTGLERQEVKEASQQNEGFYDFAGLTGLQRMLIIQQIGEANITDEVITTLNGLDYPQLLDYANEHNYQTIDKYVETCDKKLGDTGITLWEQIRDLSKKQLRGQYDAGLISSDAYYYLTTGIRISDVLAENKNKGIISDKTYNNIADADMDVSELRDKGYITQQQYDMLTTYKPLYMYYLPLKGDASITASDINDYESREQKNKSKISKVKGHENLTRDPLTQLVSDCYGAIQNEEHNRWLREVLRAARLSNLSDNVVKITPLNVGATRVATEGETAAKQGKKRNERLIADVKATNKQVDEHSVIVFDGGRAYKMTFADLSLAKALRTSGGRFADASAFVNWASRKTRAWAMMLTTLNPMFVASNTFRDVGEALFVNYVNLGAKAIPVFVRAWNPANELQKAVHRHLKGKPGNTPYDALVKEYFDNGGPTSFSMLPDFDKIKSDMDKMVRDSKRGNHNPIKMTKTVLDWLEVQARHSELLSRVATYAMYRGTLPEYNIGKNASMTEAIWQSKEVTVNFDKRGAWAKELGVTSLFWNAGRQSNRIHYNLLKNHPVRYLAATAAMSSIKVALPGLLSTLVSYLYGDDEKGKEYLDKYYAINRYTRYNNLCLLWGDAIVKIPISPSFGPTAIMSEIVSEMIYTDFDKDRALSMTADLAQSMATLVGNDVFGSVVGTIAKGEPKELIGAIPFAIAQPFAELLANRNWQGRQIMRDYQGLDYLPAYYKAYGNVEDYYIESAKWINKITGGDEGKPGKLNKLIGNPAANKHIIESYLGGLGSFIFDSLNTGANIVNGRWDRVIAESPMKRFLGDPEVYQDQEAWEDYYTVKSKINEYSARINSYKQAGNERKAYKLEDVRDELKYLLKPYDDYIDASKEDMQEALNRNPKDAREIRRKHRRDMAKYLKTLKKQIEHIDTDL